MSVDPVDQPMLSLSGPPPDPAPGMVPSGPTDLRRLSVRELIRALTAVEDARRRAGDLALPPTLAAQEAAIVSELHARPGGLRLVDGPGGVDAGGAGGTASPGDRSADRPAGAPRLVVLPGVVPEVVVPDVVVAVQPAAADPDPGDV
ncbi:hypothetical protein FB458_2369 [Lapillicoccus jejuensis]|uniref:Uncharacterized protein n=1 Tax=Lapillicoccus jejuensis TaxID=402171 RepID=A0A542E1W1_9MICO|nr:hypothetical protein FB458_2369 [Lapillicoccus jejuensis]